MSCVCDEVNHYYLTLSFRLQFFYGLGTLFSLIHYNTACSSASASSPSSSPSLKILIFTPIAHTTYIRLYYKCFPGSHPNLTTAFTVFVHSGRQPDSLDRSILEDSSASEENDGNAGSGAKFIVGSGGSVTPTSTTAVQPSVLSQQSLQMFNSLPGKTPGNMSMAMFQSRLHSAESLSSLSSSVFDDNRICTPTGERIVTLGSRIKKGTPPSTGAPPPPPQVTGRTPMPPPRKR